MKLNVLLSCVLTVAMLTACAPSVDHDSDKDLSDLTPTVEATATPTPTVSPSYSDTQEETTFTYVLEGEEYTVSAIRHHSDRGYSMIYDPTIMTFGKADQYDLFIVKAYDGQPAVQIKITTETRTVEELAEYLETIGATGNGTADLDGYEAQVFRYSEGTEPDDVVKTYYVVQAGETVYQIETDYFNEAAEGYGARMGQMVATICFDDAPDATPAPDTPTCPVPTETPAAKELKIMVRDREVSDFTSVIGEVTTLQAFVDGEAAGSDAQWTSSNEAVCTVTVNEDGSCDVKIKGEGATKVTVTCGDLSASTVVRGKKSW